MTQRQSHRLAFWAVAAILLLALIPTSCQRGMKIGGLFQTADTVNWRDSAYRLSSVMLNYYNNNQHDSFVVTTDAFMQLCREHDYWNLYYESWIRLGEEYVYVGQLDSAIVEARKMHDEAISREHDYGLAGADFVNAMVYSTQGNPGECTRLLGGIIRKLKGGDRPHFLNKVYTYYLSELEDMADYPKMKLALDEWKQSLDSLKIHMDTTQVTMDNLLNFYYMYQRGSYNYHYKMKEYREAAKAVDSIAYYNELTGMTDLARNEVLLDRVMLAAAQEHYEEALTLSDEQLQRIPANNNGSYLNALEQRQRILAGLGRWHEAYDCQLKWSNITDSIRTKTTSDQLNELNKRFEVDELKNLNEREKLKAERRQLYMLLAFVLLAALGGGYYGYSRYRSAKHMAKMKAIQERIEGELRIARDIQMSMVPSQFPDYDGLDMCALMAPAREVGGDLYGYVMLGDMLYFCVGDVSGKVVPASLFMAQATRLFRTLAAQQMMPAEICTRINDALSGDDNESGMFVTMFVGLIDLKTGHLDFCNAGHNPPVIGGTPSQGDFLQMESNAPIGLWPELQFIGEEIDTIKGRPLLIYTDGVNEAENSQQERFGDERLLSSLRDTRYSSSRQVIEALKTAVDIHRNGAEPNDDLTIMCIHVT